MKRLENKVCIITGAASGIGWVTAQKFAAEGATIVIWDVQQEKGEKAVQDLLNTGAKASFQLVNTASFEATENAAKHVFDTYGKIDVIINNAGITRYATLAKMSIDDWQKVIDVNLTGVFNCTKNGLTMRVEPFLFCVAGIIWGLFFRKKY